MTAFSVDLDQLDSVIQRMGKFDTALDDHMRKLETRIDRLHTTWTGDAAKAQRAEHEKWMQAAREIRHAMATMRSAGTTAHANYTRAINANVGMWDEV